MGLIVGLAACPRDLDRFQLGGGEGEDGGVDEGADGAPGSGDSASDCACGGGSEVPAGCAACDCPLPAVLALVESRDGSSANDGSVLLYSLATGQSCGALTGGETLPSDVTAVGWIPPATIAVGSDEVMRALNPRHDTYRWVYAPPCCSAGLPRDVFWVRGPAGETHVAAGYTNGLGYDEIRYLQVYDGDGQVVDTWPLNDAASPLHLGLSIEGMTRSPLDPSHVMIFKRGTYAAADIAVPYGDVDAYPMTYYQALPSGTPFAIHAISRSGMGRVAFGGGAYIGEAESVYYTNDPGTGPMVHGPLRCDAHCYEPARFWDAAPDPTDDSAAIAICFADDSGARAHVVRMDEAGGCEVLVDGSTLPPLRRPIRLDIAQ